jgi:cytochrome P450
MGPLLVVSVTGPEEVRKVYSSQVCSEKFLRFYRFFDGKYSLVGGSVLDEWPKDRKFTSFSLTPKCLENMRAKFEETSRDLVADFARQGGEFDTFTLPQLHFLDMFSQIFFGVGKEFDEFEKLVEAHIV